MGGHDEAKILEHLLDQFIQRLLLVQFQIMSLLPESHGCIDTVDKDVPKTKTILHGGEMDEKDGRECKSCQGSSNRWWWLGHFFEMRVQQSKSNKLGQEVAATLY